MVRRHITYTWQVLSLFSPSRYLCLANCHDSLSLSLSLSLSHTHTTHTHTPREGSFLLFTYLVAEESLDSDHRQGKPEDQTGRCVVENHPEEETRKKRQENRIDTKLTTSRDTV